MKNNNPNLIVQRAVALIDFLLMNVLIYFILKFDDSAASTVLTKKLLVMIFNFTMLIAQYFYHTIILIRKLHIGRVAENVAKLTATQSILGFIIIIGFFNYQGLFRTFVIYATTLFAVLFISRIFERAVLKSYRSRGGNSRSVILIGNDPANLQVYNELVSDPTTGYKILGYYSNGVFENGPEDLAKLGDIDHDLFGLLDKEDPKRHICDDIFCSLSHNEYERIIKIMKYCDRIGIHFFYVPRTFGYYRLQLKPEIIGDLTVMSNYSEPLLNPTNKFIKRTFDIVLSSFACICLLPLIPIIAIIIKTQSPGPIFFKQKRTGLDGKSFMCYKFRSMHVNKNADKAQATKDDPRKFAFGNFMRKANIDELPQFFNVLKGDMSIVGPRPHMLYHTDKYSSLISKYMVRHFCRPGITGLAQVTGFRGETKELWQMEERVRRDIWYIEHWSFWLDIRIIIMTFVSIFKHDSHAY